MNYILISLYLNMQEYTYKWRSLIESNNIEEVKKMIDSKHELCDFWVAMDFCKTKEMKELLAPYCRPGQRIVCPLGSYNFGKPKLLGKQKNYAVVSWFNYRKEHHAACIHLFEEYEDAVDYAYKLAYIKEELYCKYFEISEENLVKIKNILNKREITSSLCKEDRELVEEMSSKYKNDFYIISEKQITDVNGPGMSKYDSIVSFANSKDGYCCTFYCVVDYFYGIENEWNFDYGFCPNVGSRWSPQYYWG